MLSDEALQAVHGACKQFESSNTRRGGSVCVHAEEGARNSDEFVKEFKNRNEIVTNRN